MTIDQLRFLRKGFRVEHTEEDERIAAAGKRGRQIGTMIMVVFGAWFVLTTVWNFAVDVFGL
jgi:hypothetical protein